MARAIDAENTMNKLLYGDAYISEELAEYIKQVFDEQPTIEAEPMKHGKWIEINAAHADYLACSVCKSEYGGYSAADFDYCPHCGARMDGE